MPVAFEASGATLLLTSDRVTRFFRYQSATLYYYEPIYSDDFFCFLFWFILEAGCEQFIIQYHNSHEFFKTRMDQIIVRTR